jgi:hypothetical protein
MTEARAPYGTPTRGVSLMDVSQAADALLRDGERPTANKIRIRVGRGSPNTIGPLLDEWWARLAGRIDSGPAAFHRLPESVAHVAESLWMQALEEGRRRALMEQRMTDRALIQDKERLELRSHVLTLREGEMGARILDRDRTIAELTGHIQMLTAMLQKEQASRDAVSRRVSGIEAELLAARRSNIGTPKLRANTVRHHKPLSDADRLHKGHATKRNPTHAPLARKTKSGRR